MGLRTSSPRAGSTWLLALALAAPLLAGCNPFAKAKLSEMVPGGNVGTGELECWLTLEFEDVPPGIDPRDVIVRFVSEALEDPAEFDWEFIANRDIIKAETFGAGHQPNPATRPESAPPLASPVRVKFPLYAKRRLDSHFGDQIWLQVELWWGGVKHATAQRGIGHMYQRES